LTEGAGMLVSVGERMVSPIDFDFYAALAFAAQIVTVKGSPCR
jgi:hypothetical protein